MGSIIGLSHSDGVLEHIRGVNADNEMLKSIYHVFECYTLLCDLRARREFYIMDMRASKNMQSFINRLQQLSSVMKTIGVQIDNQELAVATFKGLSSQYKSLAQPTMPLMTIVQCLLHRSLKVDCCKIGTEGYAFKP